MRARCKSGKQQQSMPSYCIVHAKSRTECSAVTDSPNAWTAPTGSAIPQLPTKPPSLVSNSSAGAGEALLGLINPLGVGRFGMAPGRNLAGDWLLGDGDD